MNFPRRNLDFQEKTIKSKFPASLTNLAPRILFFAFAFPFATSRPCVIWQQLFLKCEAQIWLVGAECHLETAVSDVKEARIWLVGVGCHLEIAVSDVKSADLIGFSLNLITLSPEKHIDVIRHSSSHKHQQWARSRRRVKKDFLFFFLFWCCRFWRLSRNNKKQQKTNTNRGHKTYQLLKVACTHEREIPINKGGLA